jgi:formylglycine-generating enzyme required for sulfatase activity
MHSKFLKLAIRLLSLALCYSAYAADPPWKNPNEEMVHLHGGTFEMGIDANEIPRFAKFFAIYNTQLFQDELPRHKVTIGDFSIDRYFVTNEQFKRFTEANVEWRPVHIRAELDNGNYLKHWKDPEILKLRANHPVVNVNWYAAVAYCRWVGKRLATEAEWEYAARGGQNTIFPWGDEPADKTRANYSEAGLGSTSPVGAFPANSYGLFDMAGNAWEFLADEWESYSSAAQKDPIAGGHRFAEGDDYLHVKTRRVIRGGSFGGAPVNLWIEYRDSHPPNGSREFVGFRCAR